MSDQILFNTKLFQVVHRIKRNTIKVDGKTEEKELSYELVRRPPGVRAIIIDQDKLLLNREFRYELNDWDYRLPGGKVFDDALSYQKALDENRLDEAILTQLKNEVREEADIEVEDCHLLRKSTCGLTIEWDLYYFIVDKFKILPSFYAEDTQKSEHEFIEHLWVPFDEALTFCAKDKVSEDRSASVLMRLLLNR